MPCGIISVVHNHCMLIDFFGFVLAYYHKSNKIHKHTLVQQYPGILQYLSMPFGYRVLSKVTRVTGSN
jgi:hypothetical protein